MSFGYAPQFKTCTNCGQSPDASDIRFSTPLGGIICPRCFSQDPGAFAISMGTVKLLIHLQQSPFEKLSRFKPSRLSQREINRVIRSFFMYHMEDARELKSLKFLQSLDLDQSSVSEKSNDTHTV